MMRQEEEEEHVDLPPLLLQLFSRILGHYLHDSHGNSHICIDLASLNSRYGDAVLHNAGNVAHFCSAFASV